MREPGRRHREVTPRDGGHHGGRADSGLSAVLRLLLHPRVWGGLRPHLTDEEKQVSEIGSLAQGRTAGGQNFEPGQSPLADP